MVFNEDGSVFEVNTSFSTLLGYTTEEISRFHIWDWDTHFTHAADLSFAQMLSQSGDFFETRHLCKDGSSYAAEVSISHIEWGGKIFYMGLVRDITERKNLEQQLLLARKLESIGQLAAGVAHEINTPLQYIENNLAFFQKSCHDLQPMFNDIQQLLQYPEAINFTQWQQAVCDHARSCDFDYLQEEVPTSIQESLEGIKHIVEIVSALKEFSHPGTSNKVAANLNKLIENAIVISKNEWKYVTELQTKLDPELPLMICDSGAWSQVLLNLIVNSAHAIEEMNLKSGVLGKIIIKTQKTTKGINLEVCDTGIGISKNDLERIYDPFFTTKEIGKGTGQGLAIVYDLIVNKHRGSIICKSEPGEGTQFKVFIPQAPDN